MTTNKTFTSINEIDRFIEKLELPREKVEVLFETFADCELYFAEFHKRNHFILDDVLDFREHKIKESGKTLDVFVEEFNSRGMKYSFEATFFQPFNNSELALVKEAISDMRISITQLFMDFQKNPNKNILKYIV